MTVQEITPVVLCGGSGTRLWPLSRKGFPKQFIPVYHGKSLLELTFERLSFFGGMLALSGEEHRFFVEEAAEKSKVNLTQILEPIAKDTAPAMALAACHAAQENPERILLFCPADHFIPDNELFRKMVAEASDYAKDGNIVTFGVHPVSPSTAYGYIETGDEVGTGVRKSAKFLEKPDLETAMAFLSSGKHLWNAGIFLVRADVLADAIARFEPQTFDACSEAIVSAQRDGHFLRPGEKFKDAVAKSIDYAVMERAENVLVAPFQGVWSDVGSWNAMSDLGTKLPNGNCVLGVQENVHMIKSENTVVHGTDRRLVVTLGTKDLVVIDTPDALLVSSAAEVEAIKNVVGDLAARNHGQAIEHRRVARPWGDYDSIDHSDRYQVKRITVKPGAQLSLQRHHHRAEHWIVVKGSALVTCDDKKFLLGENQSTYIPVGAVHRMENPGKIPLELIEVQSGSYLGEDDIERLDDVYGRIPE
ncbi:mannose-1-phosphate guanylyltransferase/mannose-6-phosphate isomerase [Thalassospira xiamenensis]|uniref:mannose-1-phosphate guanylyltransferase/mannose-6-phosphate isomerase n=1 Tax=Thalassospira xiamenensis TaxID=220697 RepID=UPI003AA870FF